MSTRRLLPALVTALAAVLVFGVLVVPDTAGQLSLGALARIPVEALLALALVLLLPPRARWWVALAFGVALALVTVLKLLDIGFSAALARPFDPLYDWGLLGAAFGFVSEAIGHGGAVAVAVGAGVLGLAMLVLVPLAALRLARAAVAHRTGTARGVAAATVVWITCAVLGAELVPGVPVATGNSAALAYGRAVLVGADVRDREEFAAQLAADPYRDVPGDQLLRGLRGKDVVLALVESYGRSAVEHPDIAPQVDATLADGDRRLAAAGYGVRSGFLTSPTFGGGSWLAHATLQSGLWIDSQARYTALEASSWPTLTRLFGRADWATTGIFPGVMADWPQQGYYGYDHVYESWKVGYQGPRFSFATMPDQYALSAVQRLARPPGHAPAMVDVPLISSHAPWQPIPQLVDWDAVGDGTIFGPMATSQQGSEVILTRDPRTVRHDYGTSISYSLSSLISYVETYGDADLVLVFLGDHQPSPIVSGEGASHDVPVTIVARDPGVLARVDAWGWTPSLRPAPDAPVWPMSEFRGRFLDTFR